MYSSPLQYDELDVVVRLRREQLRVRSGRLETAKRKGGRSVYYRCPVCLSNSEDVSLIQRVLVTLVLRLTMNDGFSFDSSIACSKFFRVSWVKRWWSPSVRSSTERNNKTRSCTWAERIYIWRLLSSCRAPLKVPCSHEVGAIGTVPFLGWRVHPTPVASTV